MTDPAKIIRAAFPRWKSDPYQHAAVDALLRILFASENTAAALDSLENCIIAFLDDPPTSLAFAQPRTRAELLARKLVALATEIRKGCRTLRDLEAYINQFDSFSKDGGSHGGVRPETRGLLETTSGTPT